MSQIIALWPVWLHNISPAQYNPLVRLINSSLDHAAIFIVGWPLLLVKKPLTPLVISRGLVSLISYGVVSLCSHSGAGHNPHSNGCTITWQSYDMITGWEIPCFCPGFDFTKYIPQGDLCKPKGCWGRSFGQPVVATALKRLYKCI